MLSSISVLKVQLLAPPSPTLKHACPLCTLGSASTVFPSIQTNQKPYSLAHIYSRSWHRAWTFWSNHQSRCRHGFKSHVQCSHHRTVQSLLFPSQISSAYQTLAYWWHGYSDCCCIGSIPLWLLQLLTPYFSTCQVSISISSSASRILPPGLLSMIDAHPSNRFLLTCTGSLFKPALNLKFARLHISYSLITNLRTSDHSSYLFLLACCGHLINAYWLGHKLEHALATCFPCFQPYGNHFLCLFGFPPTLATFKRNLNTFYSVPS